MWILRDDSKGLVYRVTSGKHHIVSRKDADLLLLGDQSISRRHAELYVEDDNGEGGITLKDLQSKYGTFTILGEGELTQLQPGEEVTLKCGDSVRFGIQWNLWRAEFVPLLVAMSTLTTEEKAEVRDLVVRLGGQVVNDWQNNCTHLTMNKLTVTVKVVCALATGRPIVTPNYWKAFSQALSTMETTLPDTRGFVPPLAEAILNPSEVSFTPDPARATLFRGLTFVASSTKQLSRIKPMVTAAAGSAVCFSANSWSESKLLKEKTILMQHSANERQGSQQSQVPDGYIPVARRLRAQGVRCIPESEIGLSILHCSLAKYCNPRFNTQTLLSSSSLESTQPMQVICPDSQDSSTQPTQPNPAVAKGGGQKSLSLSRRGAADVSSNNEEVQQAVVINPDPSLDMFAPSCNRTIQRTENVNGGTKNINQQQNSEDLFGSQCDKSASKVKGGKKSLSLSRRGSSDVCSNNEPVQQAAVINPGPSLDMFAPSCSRTDQASNPREEVRTSCEDMFSSGNRNSGGSKAVDQPATSKKLTMITEEGDEDFPSISKKRGRKPLQTMEDDQDAFAFNPSKKTKVREEMNGKNDESFVTETKTHGKKSRNEDDDCFSFGPSKKAKLDKEHENKDDPFSFTNNKSKKRNRQSDPDMFASSEASNSSGNHQQMEDDAFGFGENKKPRGRDDCFAFPEASAPRKNQQETRINVKQEKVVIGILPETVPTFTDDLEPDSVKNELNGSTDSTVYGKFNPIHVKKEVKDEEMDELARELNNATIVLVKPLIVQKAKPVEAPSDPNQVNFKKFRKVNGFAKRTVPLIIGGSDLVPHIRGNCSSLPGANLLEPDEEEDDDWGFGNRKKGGRGR